MDVKNKNVTVVGMGRTADALVRLLLREGAVPFVTDASNATNIQPYKEALEELGIGYECGGHSAEAFAETDIIMPSPGVPPTIAPIRTAVENGAALLGELDFAFAHCRSKIIAVTGTNGKTTTTELLKTMLETCGHSVTLAGNNAHPFSAAVMEAPAPHYTVLEVSSYQLELSRSFHPWIGILLNISEDHIERHGSMHAYVAAKARLFANQEADEYALFNADDARCHALSKSTAAVARMFSMEQRQEAGLWFDGDVIRDGDEEVAARNDVPIPGRHNLQNALAALSAMRGGGFDPEATLRGLQSFGGVEHRLEPFGEIDGVRYINDSKATNLDSLKVALESFETPVVLIAGGRGKGADYAPLADLVARSVCALVLLGEDAPLMEEAYGQLVPTLRASTMAEAVRLATGVAGGEGTVLLSPACASFDMYSNFEERGRDFKHAINALVSASRRTA